MHTSTHARTHAHMYIYTRTYTHTTYQYSIYLQVLICTVPMYLGQDKSDDAIRQSQVSSSSLGSSSDSTINSSDYTSQGTNYL